MTTPEGAEVVEQATGVRHRAPVDLRLSRRHRHVLVVSAEGYEPQEVYIRSEANVGWWIFDAFSLGIGNIFDALIGGLFDLKPSRVYVVLERTQAPPSPESSPGGGAD